jgi:hypothetical protein
VTGGEVATPRSSRDSHPGLYDVAPVGGCERKWRWVRRPSIPGFASRAIRCRPVGGCERKWRWLRWTSSRDSRPGLYDAAPVGARSENGGGFGGRRPGIRIPGCTMSPPLGLLILLIRRAWRARAVGRNAIPSYETLGSSHPPAADSARITASRS